MNLKQIGVIHSPWKAVGEPPFQGRQAKEETVIEIFPEYAAGLKDIHRASHLIVLIGATLPDGKNCRPLPRMVRKPGEFLPAVRRPGPTPLPFVWLNFYK